MGFIGALVALWIAGETLSFVATIGIIALAGIEVKNSILMVDYTNGLREKGMDLLQGRYGWCRNPFSSHFTHQPNGDRWYDSTGA